jgi:hypothetical protein
MEAKGWVLMDRQSAEAYVASLLPDRAPSLNDASPTFAPSAQGGLVSATYLGVGMDHWIGEVTSGGTIVVLEDGSVWSIALIDRIYTMIWLPTSTIKVVRSGLGYTLVNTDDDEAVGASFVGYQ